MGSLFYGVFEVVPTKNSVANVIIELSGIGR